MNGLAQWEKVDRYIAERLVPADDVLEQALSACRAAGLPAIEVTAAQGKLLHLLARMGGAKRILEIGTLGAYSTIWLARALPPGGRLVTLELDAAHARVARANLALARLEETVELREGNAPDQLARMTEEGEAPFDFIFIDADKPNNPVYLRHALRLSRPGTVIVGDNVVRGGDIVDPNSKDPRVRGVRAFYELLAAEPAIAATAIQTVGSKGYDGFMIGIVG